MGTTTNYAWPYPELGDAPNVPADMQALADASDTDVKAIDDRLATAESDIDTLQGPPAALMYKTVDQTISNNTVSPVKLVFQDTEHNFGGLADLTNSQFVVPVGWAGIYEFKAEARWAASGEAGSMRVTRLRRNGVDIATEQGQNQNSPQGSTTGNLGREINLAEGDVVDVYVWQNSGASVDVTTNYGGTWLSARWVRRGTA